jgi:uncharacterized membrane protein YqjE
MIDLILAKYWTPKGTPLWKHHLPSLLISLIILVVFLIVFPSFRINLIVMVSVIFIAQVVFSIWARIRYGNNNPNLTRNK